MLSKPAAFGLLAVVCIAAAAGGAYVATRQLAAPVQPPATGISASGVPQAASASAAARTVGETGETVGPNPWPVVPAERADPAAERADRAKRADLAVSTPRRPDSGQKGRQTVAGDTVDRQTAGPADQERRDRVAAGPQQLPLGGTATTSLVPPTGVLPTLPPPVESAPPSEAAISQQPPERVFEELVVPADSVLGLQLETPLASDRAQVEDRVAARVTRDVRVGDRVVIPAGTEVEGSVVQVGRGGKVKERAFLAIRFHTLVMADSTRIQITTDPIYREGASNSSASAAKIGGAAVGGAILGAIIGGGRGAAIGGSIGAAGGAAAVMAGDRSVVFLSPGTLLTIRVLSPLTITIER